MHRHGYVGRKFGRERDQRRALLKGLATELVNHGKIEIDGWPFRARLALSAVEVVGRRLPTAV